MGVLYSHTHVQPQPPTEICMKVTIHTDAGHCAEFKDDAKCNISSDCAALRHDVRVCDMKRAASKDDASCTHVARVCRIET